MGETATASITEHREILSHRMKYWRGFAQLPVNPKHGTRRQEAGPDFILAKGLDNSTKDLFSCVHARPRVYCKYCFQCLSHPLKRRPDIFFKVMNVENSLILVWGVAKNFQNALVNQSPAETFSPHFK